MSETPYDYTVQELRAGLERLIQANGIEADYYNSDEAIKQMDVRQRASVIRAIYADTHWMYGMLASIKEATEFVRIHDKGKP